MANVFFVPVYLMYDDMERSIGFSHTLLSAYYRTLLSTPTSPTSAFGGGVGPKAGMVVGLDAWSDSSPFNCRETLTCWDGPVHTEGSRINSVPPALSLSVLRGWRRMGYEHRHVNHAGLVPIESITMSS